MNQCVCAWESHAASSMKITYWPMYCSFSQVSGYTKELEEMKHVTKQEFIASLRRYRELLLACFMF